MAYWRRARRPPPEIPTIIDRQPRTAAVAPLTGSWNRIAARTRPQWHYRAEYFNRTLGLVRFANGLLAQSAARCELVAEKLVDPLHDTWEPVDAELDRVPAQVLREYSGPYAETPGDLIAAHVLSYKVTGEAFLAVEARPEGGLDWSIRNRQTLQFRTRDVLVMDLPGGSISDGTARVLAPEQVRRMWCPDSIWPQLSTSHMEGVIADCERYEALARRIRREAESALTNGLLFTPEYAHKYPPAQPGQPQSQQALSVWDSDYYRIAEQSYLDDGSVAAIAPMSTHYGNEQMNRDPMPPAFIYPGRVLDPSSIPLREEAAENIARGLDLPTQLALSGQGGTKPGTGGHFSAWLMSEDFIKTSMAPTMDKVTHADLTIAMYRPILRQMATQGLWLGNPDLYRVGYDPTPIIVHPDRGATAITMYGLGLLAALPVLEANGFNEGDMPSPEQLAQILEALRAIHGRQAESIQLQSGPIRNPATEGISVGNGAGSQGVTTTGPSTVRELPPAPAMAAIGSALTPYPAESSTWLD